MYPQYNCMIFTFAVFPCIVNCMQGCLTPQIQTEEDAIEDLHWNLEPFLRQRFRHPHLHQQPQHHQWWFTGIITGIGSLTIVRKVVSYQRDGGMVPWWDQYSAGQPREAVLILSHRESKPRFQADPQLRTIIQCPTRIVLPRGLRAVGMRIWSQAASSQWSHRGHRRLLRGGASIIQPGQRTPLRGADIHQSQPENQCGQILTVFKGKRSGKLWLYM